MKKQSNSGAYNSRYNGYYLDFHQYIDIFTPYNDNNKWKIKVILAILYNMKRYALDDLRIWKEAPNRKPLILRGARQVGKTELVRIFARECFESFIEINFDEHPSKSTFFEEEDIRIVCKYIEIDAGIKLVPGKTLLFLDEIQSVPQVLARIRYFYERMPELHVICAGSLLDFTLVDHEIAMPVGRMEFMFLGPMTFGEFLCQGS